MKFLSEKHMRCIEMLCREDMEITQIAKELGVSRTTIYSWMKEPKFQEELAKTEQDIKTRIHHMFVQRLPAAVDKLWRLTDCSDNRTKLNALKEWIERGAGKVTTAFTLEAKQEGDETSLDDIIRQAEEMLKKENNDEN